VWFGSACAARVCAFSFFFSSRRRHTRFSRDWSSDVCSSDLNRARQGRKRIKPLCTRACLWRPFMVSSCFSAVCDIRLVFVKIFHGKVPKNGSNRCSQQGKQRRGSGYPWCPANEPLRLTEGD